MKKCFKFLTAACLFALTAVAASAQFGIHAGYMDVKVAKSNLKTDVTDKTDNRGLYVGFDYDINIVAGFSVQPGIYYSYSANELKNTKDLIGNTIELDHVEHSLFIPVHAKYSFNIVEDVLNIYLFAGPTFDFGLSAQDRVEYDGRNLDGDLTYRCYTGKVTVDDDLKNITVVDSWKSKGKTMQPFDILVGGGVGIRLVRFLDIKAGYDYGLINKAGKDVRDDFSMRNSRYYVGLGVRF